MHEPKGFPLTVRKGKANVKRLPSGTADTTRSVKAAPRPDTLQMPAPDEAPPPSERLVPLVP